MFSKINQGLFFLCTLAYLCAYIWDISPYWFNPEWVTDDALQQIYPFHKVYSPALFQGDLITEVMEGYLAPLHYWISYGITRLTGDAIMMSHWVMLIQLVLALSFFFLLVKKHTAFMPACFALIWLVHTRTFMQRITGGLPRGWAAPLLCAFLYFLSTKNHKAILVTLFTGCILNPPATVIAAFCYGLYLVWEVVFGDRQTADGRQQTVYPPKPWRRRADSRSRIKPLLILLALSPVYIFTVFQVVKRPESVGQMVTYEQALKMPEMRRPYGRFPFVPLLDVVTEIQMYAFQPFRHRLVDKDNFFKSYGQVTFLGILLILLIIFLYKKEKIPLVWSNYFLSILIIYFLSREFAFYLYVPNRHLQQPLTIFWIGIFTVLIWKIFQNKSAFAFIALGILIFLSNGHGFYGTSNFNYSLYKKGKVFAWLNKNTQEKDLIAGHPQHIDGTMLFARRRAYATYETAHPFYPKYFKEMLRRHTISLKAHYAKNLEEVYNLLAPEKIDYFVFSRQRFYPEALKEARYFDPLRDLVKELTSRNYLDYAYKQMPYDIDLKAAPYLLFKDHESAVIDVHKLGEFLKSS